MYSFLWICFYIRGQRERLDIDREIWPWPYISLSSLTQQIRHHHNLTPSLPHVYPSISVIIMRHEMDHLVPALKIWPQLQTIILTSLQCSVSELFSKFQLKAKFRKNKKMRDFLKVLPRFSYLRKVEFSSTMVCNCHIVCQVRSHNNGKYIYRILDLLRLRQLSWSSKKLQLEALTHFTLFRTRLS